MSAAVSVKCTENKNGSLWYFREMFQNSLTIHAVYACSIHVICLDHSSYITLTGLHDHTTDQLDSLATPFIFLQEYKENEMDYREGIDLIGGVIKQIYKRNNRKMIEAYYGCTTGMDIKEFWNIPLTYQRASFYLSVCQCSVAHHPTR